MPFTLHDGTGRFVRQSLLGSEAVYEIVDGDDELVTAEVVRAPGLASGTRVRLLTRAARAMERFEPPEPIIAARRNTPSVTAPVQHADGVGAR